MPVNDIPSADMVNVILPICPGSFHVPVKVNDEVQYYVKILSITKGSDDESLPISSF